MPFAVASPSRMDLALKAAAGQLVTFYQSVLDGGHVSTGRIPQELLVKITAVLTPLCYLPGSCLDPSFWTAVVGLHGLAIRLLASKHGDFESAIDILVSTSKMFVDLREGGDAEVQGLRANVAAALLDGDALQASARLFSKVHRNYDELAGPVNAMGCAMDACTAAAVCAWSDGKEFSLYVRLLDILSASRLLEHAACALYATGTRRPCSDQVKVYISVANFARMLIRLFANRSFDWTVQGLRCLSKEAACPSSLRRETLLQIRSLLSGPCLQFVLGWLLTLERLRLTGGEGSRHGLPNKLLRQHREPLTSRDGEPQWALMDVLGAAATVWRLTVSGPRTPHVAQPPSGWLSDWGVAEESAGAGLAATRGVPAAQAAGSTALGEGAAGAMEAAPAAAEEAPGLACAGSSRQLPAAAEQQPVAAAAAEQKPAPPLRLPGVPYSAVNVYDMLHEGLMAALDDVEAGGPAVKWLADNGVKTLELALLQLTRLALELQPRHVVSRLPVLWRTASRVLPHLQTNCRDIASYWHLPAMLGLLLRLEVPADAAEANVCAGTGVASSQAGGAAAACMLVPPPAAAEAAEPRDSLRPNRAQGCAFSLRCALDGGLLRGLRVLLRNAVADVGGQQGGAVTEVRASYCLNFTNQLLRYSGVWPALLAHGSATEVAALIYTLSRAASRVAKKRAVVLAAAGNVSGGLLNAPDAGATMHAYLAALLEQQTAVSGGTFSRAAGPDSGGVGPLLLNNELEGPGSAPMQMDWVVRAGGRPAPGSAAAAQQRRMISLSLALWLPQLIDASRILGGNQRLAAVGTALSMRLVALQAFASRAMAVEVPSAPGQDGGCSAPVLHSSSSANCAVDGTAQAPPSKGAQSSAAAATPAAPTIGHTRPATLRSNEWLEYLLGLDVPGWMAAAMQRASTYPGSGGEAADGPDMSQQLVASELELAVLGVLEVLALYPTLEVDFLSSEDVRSQVLAAAERHSRQALLSMLRSGWGGPSAAAAGSSEEGQGAEAWSDSSAHGSLLCETLHAEMKDRHAHALARLPELPPPAGVLEAMKAAGLTLCANPACSVIDPVGVTKPKTCARCRVASYCCGACQLAHWRAGHSGACAGLAASDKASG